MKKWIAILITIAALVGLRVSDPFATETVRLKTFDYFMESMPSERCRAGSILRRTDRALGSRSIRWAL